MFHLQLIYHVIAPAYFYPYVTCISDNNGTLLTKMYVEELMSWLLRNNTEGSQEGVLSPRTRKDRSGGDSGDFNQDSSLNRGKMLNMIVQSIRNVYLKSYVGGAHPLHKDVPKSFIEMYKKRVLGYLLPQLLEDS